MDEENSPPDLNAGFTLGTWTVLPNQNRIEGPDGADHLEPKVMEVLCQLARNQGEVVSRRQLMETVWRDTVVGDEVLSRSISVLRGQPQKPALYRHSTQSGISPDRDRFPTGPRTPR
jgi:DNA-binding response OmpR family regulator